MQVLVACNVVIKAVSLKPRPTQNTGDHWLVAAVLKTVNNNTRKIIKSIAYIYTTLFIAILMDMPVVDPV